METARADGLPRGRAGLADHAGRGGGRGEPADVLEVGGAVSRRRCGPARSDVPSEVARGLVDLSSAPFVVAKRTDEHTIEAIAALRRLRFSAPEIAELLDRPLSTVSGILTPIGIGRLGRLGLPPAAGIEAH